jgi:two-component system NtrC family sensor kinase
VATAGFFAFAGYLNIRLERQNYEKLILLSADRLSDIILRSTRHEMLLNDRDSLHHVIRDIGAEPGIDRVRIFNKDGLIRFSTSDGEVGSMVDKRGEACYACHAQEAPLAKLDRPDRARIFRNAGGQRTLAVIRPIENHPDCSNSGCHAHPPDKRILGVIDTHLSLAAVDEQIAGHQRQIVVLTVLAVPLFSALSAVFVWVVVHRPVRELKRATERIRKGELGFTVPVLSEDELGALAESFNQMNAELGQAHSELTDWARTLEKRVRRKTEELERAHSTLVASEKMASLGKLAATVAHEVNNPLFGMLTYARLAVKALSQDELSPEAKNGIIENLRVIERESKRCGEIMKNLLAFARQSKPHRAPNDINTLVNRAVDLVRHKLTMQQVEIDIRRSALPEACCDPGQIQQVLIILIMNAAEAMAGGGRLTIETGAEPGDGTVFFRVRDTGCGIPDQIRLQIFEPFFTTKENQHRTGLGLAIARNIVEQHGGRMDLRSEVGKGTEFTITIPIEAPTELAPETAVAAGRSA